MNLELRRQQMTPTQSDVDKADTKILKGLSSTKLDERIDGLRRFVFILHALNLDKTADYIDQTALSKYTQGD